VILFSRKIIGYLLDLVYHISSSVNNKRRSEKLLRVLIISDKPMHIDVKEHGRLPHLRMEEVSRLDGKNFSYHILENTYRSNMYLINNINTQIDMKNK